MKCLWRQHSRKLRIYRCLCSGFLVVSSKVATPAIAGGFKSSIQPVYWTIVGRVEVTEHVLLCYYKQIPRPFSALFLSTEVRIVCKAFQPAIVNSFAPFVKQMPHTYSSCHNDENFAPVQYRGLQIILYHVTCLHWLLNANIFGIAVRRVFSVGNCVCERTVLTPQSQALLFNIAVFRCHLTFDSTCRTDALGSPCPCQRQCQHTSTSKSRRPARRTR